MQNAHFAARDGRGREDRRAEELLRDGLRAGEREEDAAALDLRQCAGVEALVALHGVAQHFVVLGEGRRIEDDEVVAVAYVLQVFHGIGRERRVGRCVAEVEPHVLPGQPHGAFRRIDRTDFAGAARKCVDRESARVAKGVEHGAARGIAAHQLAVFALVEEEARFLTLFPVDEELQAVFAYGVGFVLRGTPQIAVDGPQPGVERHGLRTLVVDRFEPVAQYRVQGGGDVETGAVHARRVALHHGRAAVEVDDEPRQRVALAVHEPEAGGVAVVREAERAPHVPCGGDAALPPSRLYGLVAEGQHTHGDRADLIVPAGDEVARVGVDVDHGTFADLRFVLGGDVVDGPREDPRMAAQERLFLTFAQVYLRCHGVCVWIWRCVAGRRRCGCRPKRP